MPTVRETEQARLMTAANNLPVPVTRFIGRVREIAELERLLTEGSSESRLITLTGAGGCGDIRGLVGLL